MSTLTLERDEAIMTDFQFKAILDLIESIVSKSSSIDEALSEIRKVRHGSE
jgi:hypothetical protein